MFHTNVIRAMMMTSISNEATKTIANLANTRMMKQRARKSKTSSIGGMHRGIQNNTDKHVPRMV